MTDGTSLVNGGGGVSPAAPLVTTKDADDLKAIFAKNKLPGAQSEPTLKDNHINIINQAVEQYSDPSWKGCAIRLASCVKNFFTGKGIHSSEHRIVSIFRKNLQKITTFSESNTIKLSKDSTDLISLITTEALQKCSDTSNLASAQKALSCAGNIITGQGAASSALQTVEDFLKDNQPLLYEGIDNFFKDLSLQELDPSQPKITDHLEYLSDIKHSYRLPYTKIAPYIAEYFFVAAAETIGSQLGFDDSEKIKLIETLKTLHKNGLLFTDQAKLANSIKCLIERLPLYNNPEQDDETALIIAATALRYLSEPVSAQKTAESKGAMKTGSKEVSTPAIIANFLIAVDPICEFESENLSEQMMESGNIMITRLRNILTGDLKELEPKAQAPFAQKPRQIKPFDPYDGTF